LADDLRVDDSCISGPLNARQAAAPATGRFRTSWCRSLRRSKASAFVSATNEKRTAREAKPWPMDSLSSTYSMGMRIIAGSNARDSAIAVCLSCRYVNIFFGSVASFSSRSLWPIGCSRSRSLIHVPKFPRMKGSTFAFVPITSGPNGLFSTPRIPDCRGPERPVRTKTAYRTQNSPD
jgi:hypothetical protein